MQSLGLKIAAETDSFDIQKIINPDISGAEYQQGAKLNFWNVREKKRQRRSE